MKTYAFHYKTGEPITDEMIGSIMQANNLFTASVSKK